MNAKQQLKQLKSVENAVYKQVKRLEILAKEDEALKGFDSDLLTAWSCLFSEIKRREGR